MGDMFIVVTELQRKELAFGSAARTLFVPARPILRRCFSAKERQVCAPFPIAPYASKEHQRPALTWANYVQVERPSWRHQAEMTNTVQQDYSQHMVCGLGKQRALCAAFQ